MPDLTSDPSPEPLRLTDDERRAIPSLDPDASNDPAAFVLVDGAPLGRAPAPNAIWRGEGPPPEAVHGLTIKGKAVTIDVPADAASGFYSPHAGVLVEAVAGFKWFTGRAE